VTFAALDWWVVGLFVAGILALGLSAKLQENSVLGYLAAGRNLSLPAFVATLVSTWYGGILGVGESVSYYGLGTLVLFGLPYYVFGFLFAVYLAPRFRAAAEITIPERLAGAYGRPAGLVGGLFTLLLAAPAAHILMLGVLIMAVTGLSKPIALLVGLGLGLVFLVRGGLLADVRVSLLAFLMMYVGFGAMVGYAVWQSPPSVAWADLPAVNKSWDGGAGWPMVLSTFILGAWTLVDPGMHQRAASASSGAVAKKGVLLSVGFWMLFDCLSVSAGMYALANGVIRPEEPLLAYPALGEKVLPPGLKALFFCGMFGTILSACVGYTLVGGGAFGREIVARLRPELRDDQIKRAVQVGLFVAAGLGLALATTINSVVSLWYAWAGLIVGAMLIPTVLAFGWRGSAEAGPRRPGISGGVVLASMLGSFGIGLAWMIYGMRTGNPFLTVARVVQDGETRWILPNSSHSEPVQALIASSQQVNIGTLLPALLISALVLGIGRVLDRKSKQ